MEDAGMSMKRIYLDHNASTSLDPQILKILIKELEEEEGNPSSTHFEGRQIRRKLEQSRQTIASFFKVKPNEIIFTSGGTEGAALLIQGIMLQYPSGHVISSGSEHACVYQTLKALEKRAAQVTFLTAGLAGAVQPEEVEQAIRPETRLITLMAVNNETGVMTDLESIAVIAQRHQIPFVVDGVAWLGKALVQIPAGVSALFFSGHKFHAPKGIGFCICRQSLRLTPLFMGGSQEQQHRAGTENLPGIVALAKAVAILEKQQELAIDHMRRLRDQLEMQLIAALPQVVVNGTGPRVSNTSNLAFLGVDGEALLMNLDMAGISVSHGSACSSGALEPSRILLEMGIPLSQVRSSIRFSLSRNTTESEISAAVAAIIQIVNRLRGAC
jgi:cysteine desulfurase